MTRLSMILFLLVAPGAVAAGLGDEVQNRIAGDARSGVPIVAHVVVALCDNTYQGIVPVPPKLGDGQSPDANLYWGAAFGVRTFFARNGWTEISRTKVPRGAILERVVFRKSVARGETPVTLYVVADAWDGREIKAAIREFLDYAAGQRVEALSVDGLSSPLAAGGASHISAFVGHNGLMDFSLSSTPSEKVNARPRSSRVLACASDSYFGSALDRAGSHRLLLTTNLMAPEAYTLSAALETWVSGESSATVREAAAAAYDRYQKCGLKAARRLFTGAS